jgi:hypothetical protein
MKLRLIMREMTRPLVMIVAVVYFLIDALFLFIIRPISKRLANLPIFSLLGSWIASLNPYAVLALFVIPLVLLEPLKPVGIYRIASGHFVSGVVILSLGELLKITIVERIFHIGREKLMTIPIFAWAYNLMMGWLAYLKALPAWQAISQFGRRLHLWLETTMRRRRGRIHSR